MGILEQLWIKANLIFDLKNSELFQAIKPYLLSAAKNPLVLAFSFLLVFAIPYGLYRVRKMNASKEEKLDRLIEEMEERDDEDERPLFSEETSSPPVSAEDEEDIEESDIAILEKLAWEAEAIEDEPDATEDSPVDVHDKVEEKEDDMDHALKELMGDDYAVANTRSIHTPSSEETEDDDEAILALQAEMEETISRLTQQMGSVPSTPTARELSPEEEDDLRQEQAIKDLNTEMEETISRLSQQVESAKDKAGPFGHPAVTDKMPDTMSVLDHEIEATDANDVEVTMMDLEYDEHSIPELNLEEEEPSPTEVIFEEDTPELSLENEVSSPESTPETSEQPEHASTLAESVEEASEILLNLEPKPETPVPTQSKLESPAVPSDKVDQLIGRLENLQERLSTRFGSLAGCEEKPRLYYQQSPPPQAEKIEYKKKIIRDEDYMKTIESFIFMAGQKKRQ